MECVPSEWGRRGSIPIPGIYSAWDQIEEYTCGGGE
jgi:hypothetical protein